jgi:hypothetical protein
MDKLKGQAGFVGELMGRRQSFVLRHLQVTLQARSAPDSALQILTQVLQLNPSRQQKEDMTYHAVLQENKVRHRKSGLLCQLLDGGAGSELLL